MLKQWARPVLFAAALITPLGVLLTACDKMGGREADTPSGLPVPRYVALANGEAAARSGPSEDNRVVSVYHAKGLPVQIVAETDDWRRICDPEGGLVWVKKRLVDGHRTVIRIKPGPTALYRRASTTAGVAGWLAPRALATLDKCEKGWCKVKAGGIKGWAPQSEVWGAEPAAQCRG
jgi:SH3-like domain-containing protein